jgi:hypothetical protein
MGCPPTSLAAFMSCLTQGIQRQLTKSVSAIYCPVLRSLQGCIQWPNDIIHLRIQLCWKHVTKVTRIEGVPDEHIRDYLGTPGEDFLSEKDKH